MGIQRSIYRGLKLWNDVKAVRRSAETQSARPVVRRIVRRVYGKATGRLARKLFG